MSHLLQHNDLTKAFVTVFILNTWPRDKILFKHDNVNPPTFILVSGRKSHLENEFNLAWDVPTLSTFEEGFRPRLNRIGTFKSFSNFNNGGCVRGKTGILFTNVNPPRVFCPIKRTLGDFLDYSVKPEKPAKEDEKYSHDFLTKDSVVQIKLITSPIILPTFYFATGWGIRQLTRKEIFSIWGLTDLVNQPITVQQLMSVTPVQPLVQVLHAYFTSASPSQKPAPKPKNNVKLSVTTTFKQINATINHSWADQSLIPKSSRKEDKAPVPVELWDKRIVDSFPSKNGMYLLIHALRHFLLRVYCRRLFKSYTTYIKITFPTQWSTYCNGDRSHTYGEFTKSIESGREVLCKVTKCTWFEWVDGSALVFWKWHDVKTEARDGFRVYFAKDIENLSRKVSKGVRPEDPKLQKLYSEKFQRLIKANYIEKGYVKWDIRFFSVQKGESDIRMVFDGTKSGLNPIVWTPSFFLPTAQSLARLLQPNTFQLDMDVGEMFHNFPLRRSARELCGVNLTNFDDLGLSLDERQQRWTRLWFGFTSSPHGAVRFLSIAEEQARGDHLSPNNPFYWDRVILNLPCSDKFDPSMPWIYKWDSNVKKIAGDFVIFVDDMRVTGHSMENCWQCGRRLSSYIQRLGIQEAARKRKPPSLNADAWAGSVVKTENLVEKTITQGKWNKVKDILSGLRNKMGTRDRPEKLEHKSLEKSRGFLNHVGITYPHILPYLKGHHTTIDSWREGRDEEGWKLTQGSQEQSWLDVLNHHLWSGKISEEEFDEIYQSQASLDSPPEFVIPTMRLFDDVEILEAIFDGDTPARLPIRHTKAADVYFGFCDASGRGLGSTIQGSNENTFNVRIGVWSSTEEKENSSNWKEFSNMVDAIEEECKTGNLFHALIFMFTDNSTVEGAVAKGNSPSRKLHQLVTRLRALQMKYCFDLHVIHISGSRMIEQGTDGLSRGALKLSNVEGKLAVRQYVPLHLNALQRSNGLVHWIKSWISPKHMFLEPKHWFVEAHDLRYEGAERQFSVETSTYVWAPPPAVTDVALEQLRCATLKRQASLHVMLVPRLFFGLWRRQLYKAMDMILFLPPRFEFWDAEMHEPLIIGFVFPFIRCKPWTIRDTPKVYSMARKMQALWKEKGLDGSSHLREFLLEVEKLPPLPKHVVRKLLYFEQSPQVPGQKKAGH